MPDPGWAARTPEANDLLLKAGTGVGTHLANQTAWTTLGASHHASGVASAINTAATAASWLGVGSAASALNVTMLNATLHGLAGWVDVKPAVVSTAIAAFETANAAMRPAPECMENRDEWGVDNAINPSVLWTLTPRIVSLDVEYFGVMWPNNAAVGATYGGVLAALAESLAIPPPVATMGASPAAPAQAAAAVGQAAAEAAAGDGMRSAYQGVQAGSTGAGQSTSAGENFGNQLSFGGRWDIGRGHRGRCGRRRRRPGRRRYASDELHTSRQRFRIGHQRQAGRVAAQRGFGRRRRARADDHGGWHPYRRHAGRTCGGGSPRIPWQVRAGRDGACCR